ncbi:MAG: hypothetical protein ACLFN8_01385 [Candidatus Woesearchaeota archaeon]
MFLKKRGQVSFEYLAIFGIASLMIIPLMIIFAHQSSSIEADVAYAQAESALSRIVASAEEVYFQGPPARKTLSVHFPKGVREVLIEESSIVFVLETVDGEFNIYKDTSARLSGSLESFEGPHIVVFEASEGLVTLAEKS